MLKIICLFLLKLIMKIKKLFSIMGLLLLSEITTSQVIENKEYIKPFLKKLEENKKVTQILFIGDSHIQAGWTTEVLRLNFQERFGNAGRGLVFPYKLASTNGPSDYTSVSNQIWAKTRLGLRQQVFSQIGACGFAITNSLSSFLEISMKNPDETFDKVAIFNDPSMNGDNFQLYKERKPLKGLTSKKDYSIDYDSHFELENELSGKYMYSNSRTDVNYKTPQNSFVIKSELKIGNTFYGFQLLKNVTKGVVFNTVGINGATYADFLKYPLQMEQLGSINPDILIVSLGTNESVSNISEERFKKNIAELICRFREYNPKLSVLLITPTDNLRKNCIPNIVKWTKESADENYAGFINMYEATGGAGYFRAAMKRKEANTDGVHFLRAGYEAQANIIWDAFLDAFSNKFPKQAE